MTTTPSPDAAQAAGELSQEAQQVKIVAAALGNLQRAHAGTVNELAALQREHTWLRNATGALIAAIREPDTGLVVKIMNEIRNRINNDSDQLPKRADYQHD